MYNHKIIKILRYVLSFVFLWAFFDKTFGLGFSTTFDKAWVNGGSPTAGFLMHGTSGPLASIFQSISGYAIVDWMFMLGLLGVGVSLLLNLYTRLGATFGIIMMILMYLSVMPPANNPVVDEHIVYALVLALFLGNKNKNKK